ncbi:MAG: DegT/DnrJ/EryC1/StrS family aminotransferase [Magnetococcales bacterium]|nr:DegT/DnrJ/EryC1/StrS family aminotransferase [Magnetococcales bacterium]
MKPAPPGPILLHRADLISRDREAVSALLTADAGSISPWVERWEAAWAALWSRPAVAFVSTTAALGALGDVLAWPSGAAVLADPFLEPAWRESLAAVWLHAVWLDVDPAGAVLRPGPPRSPPHAGPIIAQFCRHPHGLPTPASARLHPWVLEEVSPLVRPLPGSGWGEVQLLAFDGNRILPAGPGAVVLSRDAHLVAALKGARRSFPCAAACALGLALLERLEDRLERRARLAEAYLGLRTRGRLQLPHVPPEGRGWEGFVLSLADVADRDDLGRFLRRSAIGAASPHWYRLPAGVEALPGVAQRLQRELAIPLYASLDPGQQKRVINRIHRWVERHRP